MGPLYFKNGDPPALILKYETKIDLSNYSALKSEVVEVWKIFKPNIEKAGQGHGFVLLKQVDGNWIHMK